MTCLIDACDLPIRTRGWCNAHYTKWRKHGDPLHGRKNKPIGLTEADAFAWFMPGSPPPSDQCWDWAAATTNGGYGHFSVRWGEPNIRAHIAAYRIFNGPIVNGADVLHSCDRPVCVQPAHLHLGDATDNLREAAERNRLAVGSRLPQAKLTEADVQQIRQIRGLSNRAIANIFGVSRSTISMVRAGKSWRHV